MDLISVIVPVYNSEKYLQECIKSILNQTYRNLEIILINDGSTDSSSAIINEFCGMDNRIKVFHKSNHGVSHSRNFGIGKANGKYLFFIDADDTIECNTLELLYNRIENDNSDCSVCNIKYVDEITNEYKEYVLPDISFNIRTEINDIFPALHMNRALNSCWGKLYKRSILLSNELKFDENYSILEDGMFVTDYLAVSDRCSLVSTCCYNYRQYSGFSLMKAKNKNEMEALSTKYFKDSWLRSILNESNLLIYYKYIFWMLRVFVGRIYKSQDLNKKEILRSYLKLSIFYETTYFLKNHIKERSVMLMCRLYDIKYVTCLDFIYRLKNIL